MNEEELVEADDEHLAAVECRGIDSEQKLVMRIRRMQKEYQELLEAATAKTNEASEIFQQLEKEREWTKALSADVETMIRKCDQLENAVRVVSDDRDTIIAKMVAVCGLNNHHQKIIDLIKNPVTGVWEKPS